MKADIERHIMPFMWLHGEPHEDILNELKRIKDSGINAVCLESRPDESFCRKEWFDTVRAVCEYCRGLGMECWILDEKHCPTGSANGAVKDHPELGKTAVTEYHMDILGPRNGAAVRMGYPEDIDPAQAKILGVVACRRSDREGEYITGEALNLTDDVKEGLLFFDVPQGCWRIFFIYTIPVNDGFIDVLRKDSVRLQIDEVYEKHYEELSDYFGNTFRGFFTDEPFIMNQAVLPVEDECRPWGWFPWNMELKAEIEFRLGNNWITALPELWYPVDCSAVSKDPADKKKNWNKGAARIAYMDAVSQLYKKNFSCQLGEWCRSHGVEYIGHIVEDNGYHTGFRSGCAHYFRALDGQDMAGIDVVLCQIQPGMGQHTIAIACSYKKSDREFFHYTLAKLGSSHAHIQPLKKGRALCEIFGAYGWAEGLPMMKWLTDFMLVRGINYFVPHAFSPRFPEQDCPPHFYAGGHNPQYHGFRKLMEYMERQCTLLSGGIHHAVCAILYHAENEWSGGKFMKADRPARILAESQIDFDIIPEDSLEQLKVSGNKAFLNNESYHALLVPYTQIIQKEILDRLTRLAESGLDIIFINGCPEYCEDGTELINNGLFKTVSEDSLPDALDSRRDITYTGTCANAFRYYHYDKTDTEGREMYMFFNEDINGAAEGTVSFHHGIHGKCVLYDGMEDCSRQVDVTDNLFIRLEPYQSVVLVIRNENAALQKECLLGKCPADVMTLCGSETEYQPLPWKAAFANVTDYTPSEKCPDRDKNFSTEVEINELRNMAEDHPNFNGYIRYSTSINCPPGRYVLDLGSVGETAMVWINGEYIGEKIAPPYRFRFVMKENAVKLTVLVAVNPAYGMEDAFSSYIGLGPMGIAGPVRLFNLSGE